MKTPLNRLQNGTLHRPPHDAMMTSVKRGFTTVLLKVVSSAHAPSARCPGVAIQRPVGRELQAACASSAALAVHTRRERGAEAASQVFLRRHDFFRPLNSSSDCESAVTKHGIAYARPVYGHDRPTDVHYHSQQEGGRLIDISARPHQRSLK